MKHRFGMSLLRLALMSMLAFAAVLVATAATSLLMRSWLQSGELLG